MGLREFWTNASVGGLMQVVKSVLRSLVVRKHKVEQRGVSFSIKARLHTYDWPKWRSFSKRKSKKGQAPKLQNKGLNNNGEIQNVGCDDGRSKASKSNPKMITLMNDKWEEDTCQEKGVISLHKTSVKKNSASWRQRQNGHIFQSCSNSSLSNSRSSMGQVMWVPFHPKRLTLKIRKNISEKKNPPKGLCLVAKVRKVYLKGIQGQRKWANRKSNCIAQEPFAQTFMVFTILTNMCKLIKDFASQVVSTREYLNYHSCNFSRL